MSDEKLMPCPWCGGEAYFDEGENAFGYVIECVHEEGCAVGDWPKPPYDRKSIVVGDLDCCSDDREKAIAAWNTRADYHGYEQAAIEAWESIKAWNTRAELGGGNCARCAEDMGRYADSLCDPLKERIAELLRCLENDWHIRASWDGLRKFWCIELTEEGVKLRDATHGTLTAEQVRDAIKQHSFGIQPELGYGEFGRCFHDKSWQAIADELNGLGEE